MLDMKLFGVKVSAIAIFALITGLTAVFGQDTKIRIGWQTTWATQGQIAQTLVHTNVLQRNRFGALLIGATYGAPLNEAALSGEVDMIFTADQPAIALISKDNDWVIVGSLIFNRVGLYVSSNSVIVETYDLKGKTIAMPFSAAAQRVTVKALIDAGLAPSTDVDVVNLVNLDITVQAGVV